MSRPLLLDLYCGAGGAAMGYRRAGFDVLGVDVEPQPNYPFAFIRADALTLPPLFIADYFAAVHASPPCPAYSRVSDYHGVTGAHPDLIGATRDLLAGTGLPYVIENVPRAPLRRDLVLCGEQFGLRLHRHRVFELGGWFTMAHPHAGHRLRGGRTNCERGHGIARWITGHYADHEDASEAMGVDWMSRAELAQAVPPAFTEYIGTELLSSLKVAA